MVLASRLLVALVAGNRRANTLSMQTPVSTNWQFVAHEWPASATKKGGSDASFGATLSGKAVNPNGKEPVAWF